jgi:GNAT superfamily N-acetyltransferase
MVTVENVSAARWDDLSALFGRSGAYSGCWCMWWRLSGREFSANGNAGNREALRALAAAQQPLGLLAYQEGKPVGWASVAPRTAFPRLLRSPSLKLDEPEDGGVWSVPCFFIGRGHRRDGVATALLDAAVRHAGKQGAEVLEGYPVDVASGRMPTAAELFTGTTELFEKAGFTVHQRPPAGRRVVMRRRTG